MKFFFIPLPVLFSALFLSAQDCSNYYYLQNNKTLEMTITNAKGKESGKMIYAMSNGNKSGSVYSATVQSEFIDAKGKSINKATNNVVCENGVLKMDMKMFIPAAQQEQMKGTASASDVYLEYPSTMNPGDNLRDGEFKIDFESSPGMKSTMEISITERKVEGMENITTPAGSWDCYKISSNNKITTRIAGIGIPIKSTVTEWFARGFGVVKTESKMGKTEITSIK